MHTINHPPVRTYYLALQGGAISAHGYVDPTERLDSSAEAFETFTTQAALDARLATLGDVLPNSEPSVDDSVDVARIILLARVNLIRAAKLELPVSYMGHPFDSDETAIQNLNGMIAMIAAGVPIPQDFGWRGADNITVPMTAQQLVGLAGTMLAYRTACYMASWNIKAQIEAATDPRTVDLYSAWPAN